jgi:hypothetical protein
VGKGVGRVTGTLSSILVGLAALGVLPGLTLRLLVRAYPSGHPRRRELVAELYALKYWERPFFVAQGFELAFSEGLAARWQVRRGRRQERAQPQRHVLTVPPGSGKSYFHAGFAPAQVRGIVGITARQLDYWVRTDVVQPFSQAGQIDPRYSYQHLLELKVVKRLLDAGIPLQAARLTLDALRAHDEATGRRTS